MNRKRPAAAVAVVLAVAVGSSVAAGSAAAVPVVAQPSAPGPVLVDQHSLRLQGAPNARDIGGYRTVDGHTVKKGLVFRSDALNKLTDADLATLRGRNLKVVEDLRTVYERFIAPDRVPAGAVDYSRDVFGNNAFIGITDPASAYSLFVSPNTNTQISAVLRDVINTPGAVLYHCSAGKDRSGWTTAVLLTTLGVDRATVNQDYLLSNIALNAAPGNTFTGVTLDELNSAFAAVNQHYGNFTNYVHQGLGLNDGDIAALEHKLLA